MLFQMIFQVKTENIKLKNDLAKFSSDNLRLKEEISRKAKEQETQEAKAREQRKMREDALQAMREREENLQEEYNRRYGAQVMICYSATIRPAKICRALRLLLIMMGEVLVLRLAMHRFGLVIQCTASEPGDCSTSRDI